MHISAAPRISPLLGLSTLLSLPFAAEAGAILLTDARALVADAYSHPLILDEFGIVRTHEATQPTASFDPFAASIAAYADVGRTRVEQTSSLSALRFVADGYASTSLLGGDEEVGFPVGWSEGTSEFTVAFHLDSPHRYQLSTSLASYTEGNGLGLATCVLEGPAGRLFDQSRTFGWTPLTSDSDGVLSPGNYWLSALARNRGDVYRGEFAMADASFWLAFDLTPIPDEGLPFEFALGLTGLWTLTQKRPSAGRRVP